jgi:sugar lactone lactonase YvrE
VLYLSPDGEELSRINLPTPLVTSCAFGGPDYSTLFITTAREDDDDPYAGRLFASDVGVKGAAPERVQLS